MSKKQPNLDALTSDLTTGSAYFRGASPHTTDESVSAQRENQSTDQSIDQSTNKSLDQPVSQPTDRVVEQSTHQADSQPSSRFVDQATNQLPDSSTERMVSRIVDRPKAFYITEEIDHQLDLTVRYLQEKHRLRKVDRSTVVNALLSDKDLWTDESVDQLVDQVVDQLTNRLVG